MKIRDDLVGLLNRLGDRLAMDQVVFIDELINAGERVLALEQIADVLSEDEIGLLDGERDDLIALNTRLGMGDRVPHALVFCPAIS